MNSRVALEHGPLRRGRRVVLQPSSVAFDAGIVGVVGHNGSGKSTLFMALAGVLMRGEARLCRAGQPEKALELEYAPQRPALPGWLTAREAGALHGIELDEIDSLHPHLALGALLGSRIPVLSPGERQVVATAIALARPAEVTLLDEPFSAVDARRRRALLDWIAERHAQRPQDVILISSQVLADLLAVCSGLVVLRDGSYAWAGPTHELIGVPPETPRAAIRSAYDCFEARIMQLLGDARISGVRGGSPD